MVTESIADLPLALPTAAHHVDEVAETPKAGSATRWAAAEGSALIISVVIIVLSFLAGVLAVDFGRITLARRSLAQAAEEAALSGAMEYNTGKNAALIPSGAIQAAKDNIQAQINSGAIKALNPQPFYQANSKRVTVRLRGEVRGLVFVGYFRNAATTSDAMPGYWVEAQATAEVCDGRTGIDRDGRCSRPDLSHLR